MKFCIFLRLDLQLLEFFVCFVTTIDADSTFKQALMVYEAYMHRVGLSINKINVLNEAT